MMMTVLWYSAVQTMTSNLEGWLPGWFSISMLVVGLIASILVLLYMVSKIFSVPTLDRKIKEEFFQLGATVIILSLLVALQTTGNILNNNQVFEDVLSSMSGYYVVGIEGMGVNNFGVAYVYLISSTDCLKNDFRDAANEVNEKETWLMTSIGATVFSVPIAIPLRYILVSQGLWDDILRNYIKAEEVMWLSIAGYFQINLLQWIEASMFAVYLPLGILLRSVPFTRGGGAAIMAIAITTYFFYPFFLALFYFNGPQLPSACSVNFEVETTEIPDSEKKCPLDPTAVLSLIEDSEETNKDTGPSIPSLNISGLNQIKVYTFYYPFITMLICLIIVRVIAQILGGNISDIGRGMVRVI